MEPREVRTACHCAGGPHEHDLYTLADKMPIEAGMAVATAMSSREGEYNLTILVTEILRHGGIASWNLVDDAGKDLPLTPANVQRRVTWLEGGMELANAAYAQWVNGKDLTPFGLGNSPNRKDRRSPTGRTASSTSRRTKSSSSRPAPFV